MTDGELFDAPPIVQQYGRRVPSAMQRRLQDIRPSSWFIFNPVLNRFAVVTYVGDTRTHYLEFAGTGYHGWAWTMNVNNPDGSYKVPDDSALAEVFERTNERMAGGTEQQKVFDLRKFHRDAREERDRKGKQVMADATEDAISEVYEPHSVARVMHTGGSRDAKDATVNYECAEAGA